MKGMFGTDGVRGIPGKVPLTPELVRRLGRAAGQVLRKSSPAIVCRANGTPPYILIGRDTRSTGLSLMRHLAAGFAEAGCASVDVGVVPTPAISYLVPRHKALCGVVISASHNPPEFNGIKFFNAEGYKLPVSLEKKIETAALKGPDPRRSALMIQLHGMERRDMLKEYLDYLRSTYPAMDDLEGVRIVVDASNGAATGIAGEVFRGLGAVVFEIGSRPNGHNINKGCGAVETDRMRREVLKRRADVGIALDGDADRAVFSDERGRLLNGDLLIALSALRMERRGVLAGGKVVLTVMSNLGLVKFLEKEGVGTVEVSVGDRNVTDALVAGNYSLGGESSGHVVFRRFAPTGDGLLTALQTLAAWREFGGRMSRVRSLYQDYPQILKNIRIAERVPLENLRNFKKSLRKWEKRLAGHGRVFVRYSGTEPLFRVLVESRSKNETARAVDDLARIFKRDVEANLA